MSVCPYLSDNYSCSARSCPGKCRLPHICDTCGYEPCINFDGDSSGEERGCWIPPYYFDKGGTPEQYWPDDDEVE